MTRAGSGMLLPIAEAIVLAHGGRLRERWIAGRVVRLHRQVVIARLFATSPLCAGRPASGSTAEFASIAWNLSVAAILVAADQGRFMF